MFLQRVAYIKNMFIIFYTYAITLSLMCNGFHKTIKQDCIKKKETW